MKINDKALDFILPDETGNLHKLSDYLGQKVVLYFYPKDLTSGCTEQALEFKRLYEEYKKENTVILGISKDSIKSHMKFVTTHDLPFHLLSDETHEVITNYGVYKEKSMYGKKYMGIVRTTYVINEEGIIISIEEKVNSKKNPADTLCILRGDK